MAYAMKPLSCDPAKLTGLLERLILSHYENNYGGAVKRLNAITAQLQSLDFATAAESGAPSKKSSQQWRRTGEV
jgi:superoxide dismutase, Fe-Mn family